MATSTRKTRTDAIEALKQLTYLAAALKAPRITEAAGRLADHARDAGWTHEEYLAAVLDREVAARNASGAQLRIRAAEPTHQLGGGLRPQRRTVSRRKTKSSSPSHNWPVGRGEHAGGRRAHLAALTQAPRT